MISGLDEVLRKLNKLPERIQKNIVTGAIRAGAKPIVKEARALVPKDTGTLKKSIGIKKRRSRDKNIVHFTVSPLAKKGGWKAHFIEFGTYSKFDHPMKKQRTGKLGKKRAVIVAKGGGIKPHPFMRPAFEKKGEESIKFVKEYMKKRVDKELAKL